MINIKLLSLESLETYLEHLSRHFKEYGVGGIIAQPHSINEPFNINKYRQKIQKSWVNSQDKSSLEKVWGLFDDETIVGHLEFSVSSLPTMNHRARMGMGLEIPYRGKGFGKQLLSTAIHWSRTIDSLDWIDLNVFSHNQAAINLYKSFGFIKMGNIPDRIRVDGQSIDDLHFALNLRDLNNRQAQFKSQIPDINLINLLDLEYQEMSTKSEKLSHSAILTTLLDFQDIFVHHEIIPPGRRSSSPHYHTHIEEMFIVSEGTPTFHYADKNFMAKPGDFIGFPPGERKLHYIINQSSADARVLGICSKSPFDQTQYEESSPLIE